MLGGLCWFPTSHPSSHFLINSSPSSNVKLFAVVPHPLCGSGGCFAKVPCSPFFLQKLPHTSRWEAQLLALPEKLSWILSTSHTLLPDGLSVFPPTVPNTWRQSANVLLSGIYMFTCPLWDIMTSRAMTMPLPSSWYLQIQQTAWIIIEQVFDPSDVHLILPRLDPGAGRLAEQSWFRQDLGPE